MSLKNIKLNKQSERGFTIVELLIVVVVIAILAAITIVSYNGITNRANASSAKSTAATWQKKIELYQGEQGGYPFAFSSLSGASSDKSYQVASTTPLTTVANLSATNGKNTVAVQPCGATTPTDNATTTGARITYWTYGTPTTEVINIGVTTACATAWAN